MAPKLRVISGGTDSPKPDDKKASDSKSDEVENEDYLEGFDKSFVAKLREHLAKMPSMSDQECLDVLIKAEGPEYVRSLPKGDSFLIVDKISREGEEILKNVRDYLKMILELRIKNIKLYALREIEEKKKG